MVAVDVPALVEQGPYVLPAAAVVQQVVALGDHGPMAGLDGDRVRDRLLQPTIEPRCGGRVCRVGAKSVEQCDVAVDVERVRCTLAVCPAEPPELLVRQMKAVHRHEDVRLGVLGDEAGCKRRLARARASRDPHDSTRRHPISLTATRGPGATAVYSDRMSSILDLQMQGITGEPVDFDQFRDQVLLIVNVASA